MAANHLRILPNHRLFELTRAFNELFAVPLSLETHLRGVLDLALAQPGSLVRAQLAYAALLRPDIKPERALQIAVAIEYFHTASLVFDDLPCMDDATERRGRPCPHVLHGEAASILGALGLVNRAYCLLWEALANLPADVVREAAATVDQCLGAAGILDGQARDLHFRPGSNAVNDVLDVAAAKTGTLIRLTLLLPAIVARVPVAQRDLLTSLATVWGQMYQILDDFKDLLATDKQVGKTTRRDASRQRPNLPLQVGVEAARQHLASLADRSADLVEALIDDDPHWHFLASLDRYLARQLSRLELSFNANPEPPPVPILLRSLPWTVMTQPHAASAR